MDRINRSSCLIRRLHSNYISESSMQMRIKSNLLHQVSLFCVPVLWPVASAVQLKTRHSRHPHEAVDPRAQAHVT